MSFKNRHTITKSQRNERQARKNRKPGRQHQQKGVQPYEHIVGKAGFRPIPTPARGLSMPFIPKRLIPDLRCPQCDSSTMVKMKVKECPECGYVGDAVDINAKTKEPEKEKQDENDVTPRPEQGPKKVAKRTPRNSRLTTKVDGKAVSRIRRKAQD